MIDIIIPLYNKENQIKKNIESILNQTYQKFKIIIIDDGSTDKSTEIIKKFQDTRIKIYKKKNEGVSKARNYGIKKTTNPYILFVDADDYLEPNMLEKMVNSIEENNSDIIICGFYSETENGKKTKYKYKKINCTNEKIIKENLIELYKNELMYNTWNKLYKREIIVKNNLEFPNIDFGEDNLFNINYLMHIKSLYNINECLYHYVREIKNSITMKYQPNFIDTRINENINFIKLFEYFKINKKKYEPWIAKRYIERTIGCLENTHRKNKLTLKEKLQETKKITKNNETKKYLKIYKTNNKKIKIILKAYQYKTAFPAFIIGFTINKFKKFFPQKFNNTKNNR